jgi:hypothetical protein
MDQLIADYCRYYNYEKLVHLLEERNLLSIFLPIIQSQNLQRLFETSVDYGIKDLVLYLYIHKACVYDPKTEDSLNIKSLIESKEPQDSERTLTFGGSLGLHPEFLDKRSDGCTQIFVELYRMRKYSKYDRIGGVWVYRFDRKYVSLFC